MSLLSSTRASSWDTCNSKLLSMKPYLSDGWWKFNWSPDYTLHGYCRRYTLSSVCWGCRKLSGHNLSGTFSASAAPRGSTTTWSGMIVLCLLVVNYELCKHCSFEVMPRWWVVKTITQRFSGMVRDIVAHPSSRCLCPGKDEQVALSHWDGCCLGSNPGREKSLGPVPGMENFVQRDRRQ